MDHKPYQRVSAALRMECLTMFRQGYGYKKTASTLHLNRYTVRDYLRRYNAGDTEWASRGPDNPDRD